MGVTGAVSHDVDERDPSPSGQTWAAAVQLLDGPRTVPLPHVWQPAGVHQEKERYPEAGLPGDRCVPRVWSQGVRMNTDQSLAVGVTLLVLLILGRWL